MKCILEVLKEAFHFKVPLIQLILEVKVRALPPANSNRISEHTFSAFQALKLETGFICLIIVFTLISIIPLCTIIIWGCSRDGKESGEPPRSEEDHSRLEALVSFDENIDSTLHCRRTFQFFLQLFSVLVL